MKRKDDWRWQSKLCCPCNFRSFEVQVNRASRSWSSERLRWIGLVNMSNRTSRTFVELFETFRSYSCVNTQVFIHDTEKLPFLAISLYREWISLCCDWKHLKMFCICVQLRNAKNGNLGHESTDKRFCVLICIQLRIGLKDHFWIFWNPEQAA